MRRSLGLSLYLLILRWTTPAVSRRITRKSDPPKIVSQRLGKATQPRPKGPLVWIQLASDGEAMAVMELIQRCREDRDENTFLLTYGSGVTPSVIQNHAPPGVLHQRAPADHPQFVERFLDHWKPDVCVLTEDDLRATLIVCTSDRGIPLILIDAQMTPDRQARWRWMIGVTASLFSRFDRILVADEATHRRLRQLGAPAHTLEVTGVLEEGTAAMPCDEDERDRLALCLSNRPVWLGAYLSASEVPTVVQAHRNATRRAHRLLLVLVPEDLSSGGAIADSLTADGWKVARRALDEDPEEETQILVADLPGEMGLWYRLAPVSFMGSSLSAGTGRNPFEPAALGSAVLHGPNISAYRAGYARLGPAKAARQVDNTGELSAAIEELLAPDRAAEMAHAAWLVCSAGAEVTDRVKELLFDALDERVP